MYILLHIIYAPEMSWGRWNWYSRTFWELQRTEQKKASLLSRTYSPGPDYIFFYAKGESNTSNRDMKTEPWSERRVPRHGCEALRQDRWSGCFKFFILPKWEWYIKPLKWMCHIKNSLLLFKANCSEQRQQWRDIWIELDYAFQLIWRFRCQ